MLILKVPHNTKKRAGCFVKDTSLSALTSPRFASCFNFVSFREITAISALANTALRLIKLICNILTLY